MRKLLSVLLLSLPLSAQTPGVAGLNDYWITPGGSPGGTSCRSAIVTTPTTMNLNVNCTPGTPFVMVWSTCPCVACFAPPALGTSTCLPPPSSACPSSNQFVEIGLIQPCSIITTIAGTSNAAGGGLVSIPLPPATQPFRLSTQAVFLGPTACTVAPFSLLFSQAWNVTFL